MEIAKRHVACLNFFLSSRLCRASHFGLLGAVPKRYGKSFTSRDWAGDIATAKARAGDNMAKIRPANHDHTSGTGCQTLCF